MILVCLCFSATSHAQRRPVPNLPAASPEDAGFDRDAVDSLYMFIDNTEHKDFRGLVVIKDNQLVIEWYFNTFWRNHIHDIRSAGKSFTSLLLGVAIKDGLVQDLDQHVYSFFPKDKYPSVHEDYKRVKLRHLLDMVSGLNADSDNGQTPGNAGQWMARDEWTQYMLGIGLAEEPGSRWVYADINAALIGAIIEEKSGMSLKDYAADKVFKPLEITEYYWYTNATNQTAAAGNLYISTLDFAKLGVLIANKGKWGSEQIIDASYVGKIKTREIFDVSDYFPLADKYGMLWYKSQRKFGNREVSYLWASGNGGNHLVVVPEENMVVALTASAYRQWYGHTRAHEILGRVLGALQ